MRIAIVGATGAVGRELLGLLEERGTPLREVRLYASPRSAGRRLPFRDAEITVEPLPERGPLPADVVFSTAGGSLSKARARDWPEPGAVVIDNTSAWRMDADTPLVVPEINAAAAHDHRGLVANPNCSTIIALMALAPLHRAFGLRRATVATYQAVSGAGAAGIDELTRMTRAALDGEPAQPRAFGHDIAFNLFSHDSAIGADGYNEEERKLLQESRKILAAPDLAISATCVRVPVYRAHSEAIHAEFDRHIAPDEAREALASAPGVRIVDDREGDRFPMPRDAAGGDDVLVGRIRADASLPGGIALFVAGDQIRKGAALNAVQIMETLRDRVPA